MMRVVIILSIAVFLIYLILSYDKYKAKTFKPIEEIIPAEEKTIIPPAQITNTPQLDIEQIFINETKPIAHSEKVEWTLALLMSLEWKRFEEVCKEWLVLNKQKAYLTNIGADGGIDIKINNAQGEVIAIAQCKAWQNKVNVSLIREFYGIMASEKINKGLYFTTSDFTQDAIFFCNNKNIQLINGETLLAAIQRLSPEKQTYLYHFATQGDYTTPSCPHCDNKMVKRQGKKGDFWGCINYPQCNRTLHIRRELAEITLN